MFLALINFILTCHIPSDHAGVTPLIEAVKNNRVDIVKVLLDRGSSFVILLNISQHLCVQQVLIL
jgi:ankyrin repeat protein